MEPIISTHGQTRKYGEVKSDINKSVHILNASTSLVGFSFVVLTSVKVLKIGSTTSVDDIAASAVMIFIVSTVFSFLSIRTREVVRSEQYETLADYIFLAGLGLLFITVIIFTFAAQ